MAAKAGLPVRGSPPPPRRAVLWILIFRDCPLSSRVCADPGQAVVRYRGLDSFLWAHPLSSVGTLTLPGAIRGGGGGRVLLPWRTPPPPGLPLPRLLWHRFQSILSPPISVPAAWAPASCVFLGMLRNSVATKEISLEFARRALTGHSNHSAKSLDRSLFSEEIATLQVKRVSPQTELHLTGAAPCILSGISVKFLKLPGKPALSGEADGHSWGVTSSKRSVCMVSL